MQQTKLPVQQQIVITVTVKALELTTQPLVTLNNLLAMQDVKCETVKLLWKERGETMDTHGLWRSHEGLLVAPTALLIILINDAHGLVHCTGGEILQKLQRKGYWSPYLQVYVDKALHNCGICEQFDIRKFLH